MDEHDCALINFLLIEELVLDRGEVDKVAHARRHVPASILCVDIDLAQALDHLILVCNVCLCAWCGCRSICALVAILAGFDNGKGKRVCDLKSSVHIHADQGSSGSAGKGLAAMLDDAGDDQGVDLNIAQRYVFAGGSQRVIRRLWVLGRIRRRFRHIVKRDMERVRVFDAVQVLRLWCGAGGGNLQKFCQGLAGVGFARDVVFSCCMHSPSLNCTDTCQNI